jgi:serine/threonine protein phosphatase PrpC
VGRVRSANEDACDEFEHASGARLLVVADGMGGHRGGATASQLAVETIGEVFAGSEQPDVAALRQAMMRANDRVHAESTADPALRGMGTTVVALLLAPGGAGCVAHVGDSRAYRLRDRQLEPLTEDHSVVREMVRREIITPEEAALHPRRHEILRSIGIEPNVEPELRSLDVREGDRYLLCSDGLSNMVEEDEIEEVLGREPPGNAVRTLVRRANASGGADNITIQIAVIESASPARNGDGEGERGR